MIQARYIRVSTNGQNTIRQEVRSTKHEVVYTDKVSGSIPFNERPRAKMLLAEILKGNINSLNVSSIDRLGRNNLDILTTLQTCRNHGVEVKVENLGLSSIINKKENPVFNLIVSVMASISEMERENLRERQQEGIKEALKAGKYKGRVKGTTEPKDVFLSKHSDVIKEIRKNKLSISEIARIVNKSKGTVVKVKKCMTAKILTSTQSKIGHK